MNPSGVDADGVAETTDTGITNVQAALHATVYTYSAQDLRTAVFLPWGNEGPTSENGVNQEQQNKIQYRADYRYDSRGRPNALTSPYKVGPGGAEPAQDRVCYEHFETGWIRSASDPSKDPSATACEDVDFERLITYDYTKRGEQTKWDGDAADPGLEIHRTYWPNGTLKMREACPNASLDDCDEGDSGYRAYDYYYNPNRSLVRFIDLNPPSDDPNRVTFIARDTAERGGP